MSEILSDQELRQAMEIVFHGLPRGDNRWGCISAQEAIIASHRALQTECDALKDDLATVLKERNDFEIRCDALKAELAEKDQLYHELLYQVGNKYPNESRHETALRYLKRAEQPSNEPAQCAKEDQP